VVHGILAPLRRRDHVMMASDQEPRGFLAAILAGLVVIGINVIVDPFWLFTSRHQRTGLCFFKLSAHG
jgi:hypothetical protein